MNHSTVYQNVSLVCKGQDPTDVYLKKRKTHLLFFGLTRVVGNIIIVRQHNLNMYLTFEIKVRI